MSTLDRALTADVAAWEAFWLDLLRAYEALREQEQEQEQEEAA